MTSIKLFFRESSMSQTPGSLYFRIVHRRKIAILNTGVKILPAEWDKSDSTITGIRASQLMMTINQIRSRIENIVAILENRDAEYSTCDIMDMYHDSDAITGIITLARSIIKNCRQISNHSAAEHFTTVTNNFQTFLNTNLGVDDIPFEKFDSQLMGRYEAHLKQYGLCPNTTSSYMRKLRVIYNTAVERKLTTQLYPFKHVYTGVAKTEKRALSLEILRQLRNLQLDNSFYDKLARDMFLFSFYTRGMSTVDMAYLKKTDLKFGLLTYRRKKTGQNISIKWEPAMQKIVDEYADSKSDFLLPLIKPEAGNERRQYLSSSHLLNRHLNHIGKQMGLSQPLTMYVARHTWASIAQQNEIPVAVISQGMGHDSESTTRIYLASLDRRKIDVANNSIIALLEK